MKRSKQRSSKQQAASDQSKTDPLDFVGVTLSYNAAWGKLLLTDMHGHNDFRACAVRILGSNDHIR